MTDQVTDAHNPTPATEPLALRLSEGLGPTPRDDDSRAANVAAGLPVLYDMDCAPLDGTLVQLLVKFDQNGIEDTNDPAWTIGSHSNGEWNFVGWCWHTDDWARGSGDLLGWLPVGPNA